MRAVLPGSICFVWNGAVTTMSQQIDSRRRILIAANLGRLACQLSSHTFGTLMTLVGQCGFCVVLNVGSLGLAPAFFLESDEAWANEGIVLGASS